VRPLAQSDGHDAPWLIDELVPCVAAMVDEIVIGFETTVGEPVVAHVLPDVLNRVEFWGFRRQGDNGDVGRHDEKGSEWTALLRDISNPDKHRTLTSAQAEHALTFHVVDKEHLRDFDDLPGPIRPVVTNGGTEVYVKFPL
jgi:hypothetical protein